MSTRCNIEIMRERYHKDKKTGQYMPSGKFQRCALLYRHSNGYPDGEYGVLNEIVPFIKEFVYKRGWDPEYLAARLLQYLTNNYDKRFTQLDTKKISLVTETLCYGICRDYHCDISYLYRVYPDRIEVLKPIDVECNKFKKIQKVKFE